MAQPLAQLNTSNWPNPAPGTNQATSMWKTIVDQRVAQGYSAIQTNLFPDINDLGNEGGMPWQLLNTDGSPQVDSSGKPVVGTRFTDLNPSWWRNVDSRLSYAAAKGLVVSVGLAWGFRAKDTSHVNDWDRLARYVVARYGAYPTIWTTAGEYSKGSGPTWDSVGQTFYNTDPYKRISTVHPEPADSFPFRSEAWDQVYLFQSGHGNPSNTASLWSLAYNAVPTHPILEGEANYEGYQGLSSAAGFVPGSANLARSTAWRAVLNGSAGYTYGAGGLWNDTYSGGGYLTPGDPWYVAMQYPGGAQIALMGQFLQNLNWWMLQPGGMTVTWSAGVDAYTNPAAESSCDGSTVVSYLTPAQTTSNTNRPYTAALTGLSPAGTYHQQWFDPRLGTYSDIGSMTPAANGTSPVPTLPDTAQDWVLLTQQTAGPSASHCETNLVPNISGRITYGGGWTPDGTAKVNSAVSTTNTPTVSLSCDSCNGFRWEVTSFRLLTGNASYSIDGGPAVAVHVPYNSPPIDLGTISYGAHTVVITVTSGSVDSSGITVKQTAQPMSLIDDTSPRASYAGSWTTSTSTANAGYGDFEHASSSTSSTATFTLGDCRSISWFGEKTPASGIGIVYIDNVERARIDLYAATRQAPTAPLYTSGELSGPVHTIAIRPLGDHTGASTGNAVSIDAIGCLSPTGRVDESQLYDQDAIASHPAGTATATLSSISYQGVWGSFGGLSGRYGPTVRSANSVGVKVTVTCTQCTGLEWYGSRNASMGIANVSVDGAATTTVDQFNPTQTTSQRMFGVSGLVLGSHTLTVSVSGSKSPSARGTYLEVDAVGVF